MIGRSTYLASSIHVADSFAQDSPALLPCRLAFSSPINSKLPGPHDGSFDSQNAALLVVHLERIAIEGMADSDSFGSSLKLRAYLALKARACFAAIRGNLSAKEAQHVWTLEGADRMADKFRIELLEFLGLIEEHIGSVFALGSTPVVA